MVNIRALINREKSRFNELRKKRIEIQTEKLKAEKQRQGELAKLNAQKQKELRDLEALKKYNAKVQGPSAAAKFGKGLARVINEGKEKAKKNDVFGVRSEGPFSGSGKGINFGGSGKDIFGHEKKIEKQKSKPIIIKIGQ